ncbi:serine hydrolase [Flavihumibacter petaseus]|uniref:Peptidase S12 family protein n=1 Tax=Flavihumibacter petaseus NBRC 106054 TaxID=1220578 RepID=A0A0E9N4Z5_9BACT|nr:serine hydrolase [Flavihumibacter petaseus]GAO44771.1 peptidase S12 family protein [Flavihumibacter petaseus NBRC 106054]
MKRLFLLLISLCSLQLYARAQDRDLPPQLDQYISQVLKTFEVPGMSIGIVKNGRVLLAKGYGVKTMGSNDPVSPRTLFCIASNTKAFTATALAILAEEGKLRWEDPVIDHLPWFRMSDPALTAQLTVRDLLVHHSGIPAYGGDVLIFPPSSYSRRAIVEKVKMLPVKYPFRTIYAYDNILYLAAGELISTVSGMPWEDFIRVRILEKAGMNNTVSKFSLISRQPDVSGAHTRIHGVVTPINTVFDQAVGDAGNPAGGIASSAQDMCQWLITQLDSGRTPSRERILSPDATAELWKMVRPMPITRQPVALKAAQQDFYGYCLGFRTYNYGAHRIIGHGGKLDGFVSQIAMVPAEGLGIVVLTNQESTGAYWSVIYHLLDYFLKNPKHDWINGYKTQQDSSLARIKRRTTSPTPSAGQNPSPASDKIYGTYTDPLYGSLTISQTPGGAALQFDETPVLSARLSYYNSNSYLATFTNPSLKADCFVNFSLHPDGSVSQLTLQLYDPDTDLNFDNLVFKPVTKMPSLTDTAGMRKSINAVLATHPEATYGIAFKDIGSGQTFYHNEKSSFHAASTMKTPVLIETYRQAKAGKFSLTDSILVKNTFASIVDGSPYSLDASDDSEFELYQAIGKRLPINDILYRMITRSSNLATNMMIELVGAENVMATMRSIGANDIRVLRGVEDDKAFEKGLNNTTTAYDLMLIMEHIARGTAIDRQASQAMISILTDQYFRDIIPARLPKEVKVASKTGSINGICHDSGIVFLPDGRRYVLILLSKGIADLNTAKSVLAQVSEIIYKHYNPSQQ